MITDLDETIKQLLIKKGAFDPAEVDIGFRTPDREWSASISKPTVVFNLYDIRENHQLRSTEWIVEKDQQVNLARILARLGDHPHVGYPPRCPRCQSPHRLQRQCECHPCAHHDAPGQSPIERGGPQCVPLDSPVDVQLPVAIGKALADDPPVLLVERHDCSPVRPLGTVDGHEWVIYTAYNRAVIEHSANNEAYLGVYDDESLGALVSEKGVEGLELIIAAYAMEADLNEACEEVLEELGEVL